MRPSGPPSRSRIVNRSASAWHGCSKSDSALTTGTEAAEASSSSRSCSNVRSTTASTYRQSTRPVSSMVSPRPSWSSVDEITSGCAPSSATPTSNDTRVRVDGFSKISATERPWSAFGVRRRVGFHLARQLEESHELRGGQVVDGQVVTRHRRAVYTGGRSRASPLPSRSSPPSSSDTRALMRATASSASSRSSVRPGSRKSTE